MLNALQTVLAVAALVALVAGLGVAAVFVSSKSPASAATGTMPRSVYKGTDGFYYCTTPAFFDVYNKSGQWTTTLGIQTQGSTDFEDVSTSAGWSYNALAFNRLDGYLYAISNNDALDPAFPPEHLLRITIDGSITDLGLVSGLNVKDKAGYKRPTGGINTGFFDNAGKYWVSNGSLGSGGATGRFYTVDLTNRTATSFATQQIFPAVNDWAYTSAKDAAGVLQNFAWGIVTSNDPQHVGMMARMNLGTGAVDYFNISSLGLPAGIYGAAWTYGNGNLGFDLNGYPGKTTSYAFQIQVTNQASANPTFSLFAKTDGPASYNNDGAACNTAASDYSVEKTLNGYAGQGQVTLNPGTLVTWTVKATNNGPGVSSGFVVTDTVPDGYTSITADMGTGGVCQVSGQAVRCVSTGVVNPGETRSVTITALVPITNATCIANKVQIFPNEADVNTSNNIASSTSICPGPNQPTTPPLSIAKTSYTTADAANPQPPHLLAPSNPLDASTNLNYKVTVTNNGTTDQTNVLLSDPLPAGTQFVPNSARITYPTGGGTTTGTWTAKLPSYSFDCPPATVGVNPSCQSTAGQLISPTTMASTTGSTIPVGAVITGYTISLGGTTTLFTGSPGNSSSQIWVVANNPDGTQLFATKSATSTVGGDFGTSASGAWTTVTKTGSLNYTVKSGDKWALHWYDAVDNSVTPDQKADNVQVTFTYTMPSSRTYKTSPTHLFAPNATLTGPDYVVAQDGITLQPGETLTLTYQVTVSDKTPATFTNTASTRSNENPTWISAAVTDHMMKFSVAKTVNGTDAVGPAVTVANDGTASITYVVTIRNTGEWASPAPAITDTPTPPDGFTITGTNWQPLGGASPTTVRTLPFTLPSAGTLDPGATYSWLITLNLKTNNPTAQNWTDAGTCGDPTALQAKKGVFNQVAMNGGTLVDSDGPGNNQACVPLIQPAQVTMKLYKSGTGCDTPTVPGFCPLAGAQFRIYSSDPSQPGATVVGDMTLMKDSTGATTQYAYQSVPLQLDTTYWVVETHAATTVVGSATPYNFQLLADPIMFQMTRDGLQILHADQTDDTNVVVFPDQATWGQYNPGFDTNSMVLKNVRSGDLPKAGGDGPTPFVAAGLGLLLVGGLTQLRRPRRKARRAA